jgi:hypothetical protein
MPWCIGGQIASLAIQLDGEGGYTSLTGYADSIHDLHVVSNSSVILANIGLGRPTRTLTETG